MPPLPTSTPGSWRCQTQEVLQGQMCRGPEGWVWPHIVFAKSQWALLHSPLGGNNPTSGRKVLPASKISLWHRHCLGDFRKRPGSHPKAGPVTGLLLIAGAWKQKRNGNRNHRAGHTVKSSTDSRARFPKCQPAHWGLMESRHRGC